jgi:hypothetical protein
MEEMVGTYSGIHVEDCWVYTIKGLGIINSHKIRLISGSKDHQS